MCDPTLPHYGFTSWDKFFTHQFGNGIPELTSPTNDSVITSVTECTPFAVQAAPLQPTPVQLFDKFWIEGNPTRSNTWWMMNSALSVLLEGRYSKLFLVLIATIVSMHRYLARSSTPRSSPTHTTPSLFCTASNPMKATRPWIMAPTNCRKVKQHLLLPAALTGSRQIIQMSMIIIGIAEVLTVDITVPQGHTSVRGDPIGMFSISGSSHCSVLHPHVKLTWSLWILCQPKTAKDLVKIKSQLATISTQ